MVFYYPQRIAVDLDCGSELITKQEFKDECDINNIIAQYKQTGLIQHVMSAQPVFADLPDELDFQTALNVVQQAEESFATLPAPVRRYFDNDPQQLLAALDNESMRPVLEELGVLKGPLNPQPPGNPANTPSFASTLSTEPRLPTTRQPGAPSDPAPPAPAPAGSDRVGGASQS